MDDPDAIQVEADVARDAEGGGGDANPPRGRVNNGVYLRRNAGDQAPDNADEGQDDADPGDGDRPPLERNPKEDDWKAFQKVQPKFYLDKDWDVHYGDWYVMAKKFRLSDASLKDCLYWSIQDGAKKLIYPDFLPDKRQNRAMTAQEYAQKLKEVFLPPGESDAAKIEFERRVQLPGESPDMYFNDKKRIFEVAYQEGMRDWAWFRDKMVKGLANNEMRLYMRQYRPENDADMIGLKQYLIFQANVVRKKYLDGELPPQLLAGAEGRATQISYAAQGSASTAAYPGARSKHELFSVERLNAMGSKAQKGQCFHCGSSEHYIGQCPRRSNGLEPSPRVAALNEEKLAPELKEGEEQGFYWEEIENPHTGEINMIKRRGFVPKGSNPRRNPVYSTGTSGRRSYPSNNLYQQYVPKAINKNAGTGQKYNQGKYKRRIAHVLEDSMGNLYLDSEEQPTEDGAGAASAEADEEVQHVQHEIDGVNVLGYQAMDQVMDMLPEPFLGQWN